jgi:hypothetical protein
MPFAVTDDALTVVRARSVEAHSTPCNAFDVTVELASASLQI